MIFRTNKLDQVHLACWTKDVIWWNCMLFLILFAQEIKLKIDEEKKYEKLNYKIKIQITDICNNTWQSAPTSSGHAYVIFQEFSNKNARQQRTSNLQKYTVLNLDFIRQ